MGSSGTVESLLEKELINPFKPSWVRLEQYSQDDLIRAVIPFKPSWVRLELAPTF